MTSARLAGDTLRYLPVNLLQAAQGVVMVVAFTHLLEPEQFGRYLLASVTIQAVLSMAFFWISAAATRHLAIHAADGTVDRLAGTAFAAVLGIVLLLGTMAVAAFAFVPLPADLVRLGWGAVAVIAVRPFTILAAQFHRAACEPARYSLLEGGQCLLSVPLGVLAIIWLDLGEAGPLYGLATANAVLLYVDLPWLWRRLRPTRPSRQVLVELAEYGFPLSLATVLMAVMFSADRYIIAWLIDEAAVGIYGVAYSIANRPLSMIFVGFSMAATPVLFQARQHGAGAAAAVMERNFKNLILVTLPAATGLILVTEPLTAMLSGAEYESAATTIIPCVAAAALANGFMTHYAAHAFQVARNTRTHLAITAFAAALNVGLNVLLIPRFGLMGAAVASLVAYTAGFFFTMRMGRHLSPLPVCGDTVLRAVAACMLMAGAVSATPAPQNPAGLALLIGVGVATYTLAAIVLNVGGCRLLLVRRQARPV